MTWPVGRTFYSVVTIEIEKKATEITEITEDIRGGKELYATKDQGCGLKDKDVVCSFLHLLSLFSVCSVSSVA